MKRVVRFERAARGSVQEGGGQSLSLASGSAGSNLGLSCRGRCASSSAFPPGGQLGHRLELAGAWVGSGERDGTVSPSRLTLDSVISLFTHPSSIPLFCSTWISFSYGCCGKRPIFVFRCFGSIKITGQPLIQNSSFTSF